MIDSEQRALLARERKLVGVVAQQLRKEGGVCRLEDVVAHCREIRSLLRERKLKDFLEDYPDIFVVTKIKEGKHEKTWKVSLHFDDDFSSEQEFLASAKFLSRFGFESADEIDNAQTSKPPTLPSPPTVISCRECGQSDFHSKNSLFRHIREIHQQEKSSPSSEPQRINNSALKCGKVVVRKVKQYFVAKTFNKEKATNEMNNGGIDAFVHHAVPLGWLVIDRKIKSAMRSYLQSLSMEVLSAENRHEYNSPLWWQGMSVHLLRLLSESSEFTIHGLDSSQDSSMAITENDAISLRDVQVECHFHHDEGLESNVGRKGPDQVHTNASKKQEAELADLTISVLNSHCSGCMFVHKPEGVRMEDLIAACNAKFHSSTYAIQSVSRLDQPTSGAVVIPLSLECEKLLTNKFQQHLVEKVYVCVVTGDLRSCSLLSSDSRVGEINVRLRHCRNEMKTFAHPSGKSSITKFACAHYFPPSSHDSNSNGFTLVVCKPISGRTHQIRAHMAHLGSPLLGDMKYSRSQAKKASQKNENSGGTDDDRLQTSRGCGFKSSRLMLHSLRIRVPVLEGEESVFGVPSGAAFIEAHSPLPDSFMQSCIRLHSRMDNTLDSCLANVSSEVQSYIDKAVESLR